MERAESHRNSWQSTGALVAHLCEHLFVYLPGPLVLLWRTDVLAGRGFVYLAVAVVVGALIAVYRLALRRPATVLPIVRARRRGVALALAAQMIWLMALWARTDVVYWAGAVVAAYAAWPVLSDGRRPAVVPAAFVLVFVGLSARFVGADGESWLCLDAAGSCAADARLMTALVWLQVAILLVWRTRAVAPPFFGLTGLVAGVLLYGGDSSQAAGLAALAALAALAPGRERQFWPRALATALLWLLAIVVAAGGLPARVAPLSASQLERAFWIGLVLVEFLLPALLWLRARR